MLVNQPTNTPTPKIQAVGIAGSIVTVVLLVASIFGIQLPVDSVNAVAVGVSALVTIITFLAGYFKRNEVK